MENPETHVILRPIHDGENTTKGHQDNEVHEPN